MTFTEMHLDPRCLRILEKQGITTPTPIQEQAIPVALSGRDLIAIAQTGTGKTLAFGLPALARLENTPRGHTGMLVLAPTRELAQQVHDVLAPLARAMKLTSACIYGGVGMAPQEQALRRGVSIVVATPGRLLDHIQRRNTRFSKISELVLDEADRMLDMGFLPDIRRIMAELPAQRQTMMFSATFPDEIANLTKSMQNNPHRIEIGAVAQPVDAVHQTMYAVARDQKSELLADILREKDVTSTVVFVRTKRSTDRVAKTLERQGYRAAAIHGGYTQNRRQRAIDGFRKGRHKILVATDVAARGLDVKGISHVINYDLPATSDDYVHRIGRTARASATGNAITFVCPDEGRDLALLERAIGRQIERISWDGEAMLDYQASSVRRRRPAPAPARKSFKPKGQRRSDNRPRRY
ncbi:DEAD/DEAH box helicase [bacterium]|nr:DEAD/DEAH box helicase [bacterium]